MFPYFSNIVTKTFFSFCFIMPVISSSAIAARISMSGEDLDLTLPCTGQVRIVVNPQLKDGATLDSSNSAQVIMREGKEDAENRISITTKTCAPTGKVTISISPNTGVSIHDSHDTHFTISGKLASLDASLDSTTLDVSNTQSLDLSMHGASSVHVGTLERAAQIVASGSSRFTADNVQLTALSAQLTDNTSLSIAQGSIDALTLVTANNATATVLGDTSVATITANGSGAVNIERVSGPIVRSGNGTVRVGTPSDIIYHPTPTPPPSSNTSSLSSINPSSPIPTDKTASSIIIPPPPPSPPIAATPKSKN